MVGARPQFIKSEVLSRAIRGCKEQVSEILVHTGQHYDQNMSAIFFDELNLRKPDYNLGVGGGTHAQNTGRILEKIEAVMVKEQPNIVVVFGDTDSTLAGALAAAKLNIPVAHVEAGLRSRNKGMPEETNRILSDHVSSLLFSPTKNSVTNLLKEGIAFDKIKLVGDIMFDAMMHYQQKSKKPQFMNINMGLNEEYILCTIHRAENTDNPQKLSSIIKGLANSKKKILMPMHPRTRKKISDYGILISKNINILPPVGYLEMNWLENNCSLVVTDSGGVQKEAYFHEKFCITVREETEWPELIDAGANELVGTDATKITESINRSRAPLSCKDIYGSGDAGIKILNEIINYINN